ncbi:hypothetical protein [Nostoc sp.]
MKKIDKETNRQLLERLCQRAASGREERLLYQTLRERAASR